MTESVRRMIASLVHRGPDDAGLWSDESSRIALGNRRLAIVDPTPAGHQPMHSPSGRYVVTLNGEIYNHAALKARLDSDGARAWRGTSDTEVMTAAFDAWGIEGTLALCTGMFAVAIWDRRDRRLALARDRIGERPLFYGRFQGTWLFGSEIKALATHPKFRRMVDPAAFSQYMALGYVPAPASIFRDLHKVMPGTFVTLEAGSDEAIETTYWSAVDHAARPRATFARDVDAVDALETLLADAIAQQLVADRPVGALLSGGVDSSTVVALMAAQRGSHVRTFSIGFAQSAYNEAGFAADVARHCATHHTELYVTANDVRDTIPLLPTIYDEPLADISQIPAFLVSRLASETVTVALTGDGGDELFGGYPRYGTSARLWAAIRRTPRALRPAMSALLERAPEFIDRAFSRAFPHDEVSGARGLRPAQKLGKLGRAFGSTEPDALYWRMLAPWAEPSLVRGQMSAFRFPPAGRGLVAPTIEEDFMLRDLVGYLPDDILAKMDRAAMAVSLETRAPLLDHRIVEFALRLPFEMKFRDGRGKWLLREVLHRHVPIELVDRPKMGFGVPIASWLRGPLRPWAEDLIASCSGDVAELLDLRAVKRMLGRHASGLGDWHQPLWAALMFIDWARSIDAQTLSLRTAPVASSMPETVWRVEPMRA